MKRLLPLAAAIVLASPAARAGEPRPGIDPHADAVLQHMSDYLASLNSFRVDTQVVDERVTTEGQKLQFVADSSVALRRPDRLRVDRVGPASDVVLRYDGRSYMVLGKRANYYATAPAPPTIDAAIETARARYGIEAPAGDLFVSRPYQDLMSDVQTARYVGEEPVDGVLCHHLAFRATDVDWQIWIEDGPQPLPRRYVITSKDQPQRPEFIVSLRNWQPDVALAEGLFQFSPPPGAQRINLMDRRQWRSAR